MRARKVSSLRASVATVTQAPRKLCACRQPRTMVPKKTRLELPKMEGVRRFCLRSSGLSSDECAVARQMSTHVGVSVRERMSENC